MQIDARRAEDVTPAPGTSFRRTDDGFVLAASLANRSGALILALMAMLLTTMSAVILLSQLPRWTSHDWGALGPMVLAALLWTLAAVNAWGCIELTVSDQHAVLFGRIGSIGLRRRFDWRKVCSVDVAPTPKGGGHVVALLGPGLAVRFGSMLPDQRVEYVVAVLRALLAERLELHRRTGPYR